MFKLVSRSRSLREGKGAGRRAAARVQEQGAHVPDGSLHGGPETVSDKTLLHTTSYNGYGTPSDASTDAERYASRPLPATPTSRANMTDRPSTSGGLDSKQSAPDKLKFDKRVSRDDFYIGSRVYGDTRPGPFVPFRGQPPTPDASPRTVPLVQSASAAVTWEPSVTIPTRGMHNESIGMALGSPTHPPNFSDTWNSRSAARTRKGSPVVSPPASINSSTDTFDMPISRKPTGKWKLFGIFGRKQPEQPVPAVSISDPNGLYGTNRPEEESTAADLTPPRASANPVRSNTSTSRKNPKHKPIVVRSQTMPLRAKADVLKKSGENVSQGEGRFGRIPIALETGVEPNRVTRPMLNVEIPDIRLERYSVMFNSVLNSNPSLLSRRQATVQKLKGAEDTTEREKEHHGVTRRGASPQPVTRSSGLALFPTTRQAQNLVPQKLSPRLRSNTSPAFLQSPSKATFEHSLPSRQRLSVEETSGFKHPRRHSPHYNEKPGVAVTTEADTVKQEASPEPPQFSNDHSNLILDSPTDIKSQSDEVIPWQAWKPPSHQPVAEPKWQMISPSQKTPSTASSYTSSYRKRSPSLASSSRTHITQPQDDYDDASYLNGGGNSSKMTPVEISIARQISISRQQRKLLQPLRTGPSPSVSPGRKPSHPSPPVHVGEAGRIAETKTSTPTLVHPPDTLDSHLALAHHRRSERIVLEDA
ncbi:hypothetical protein F4802DRAFT_155724 [Xylaria palmicola]|nr:hypothetical protein F4802DRAFT_155724 [Xylaria palmicola]